MRGGSAVSPLGVRVVAYKLRDPPKENRGSTLAQISKNLEYCLQQDDDHDDDNEGGWKESAG